MANVTVHIIESPSPDDFLDDRREGEALNAALVHAQIGARLHTVVDAACFAKAIGRALAHHKSQHGGDNIPIVHLSMHGNEDGVALTNGNRLDWLTLGSMLRLANETVGGVLLVAMSTCQGFNGIEMARVGEGVLPFLALVGPSDNIAWSDTVAAFVAFYHHLVRSGGKLTRSTEVMNAVLARDAPLFQMRTGVDVQAKFLHEIRKARALRDRLAQARRLAESKAREDAVREGWASIVAEIQRAGDADDDDT